MLVLALADEPVTPRPSTADAFRRFANVLKALQQHYIDPAQVQLDQRATLAFRQFVRSLDPEADLLTAAEFAAARTSAAGDVGLTIAAYGDRVVVVSAREGSPAQKAGFFTGDEIITRARLTELRALLRGPVGEPVVLGNVSMVRAPATNVPPSALKFLQSGVAYCRLADFSGPAQERLVSDLARAGAERARALI